MEDSRLFYEIMGLSISLAFFVFAYRSYKYYSSDRYSSDNPPFSMMLVANILLTFGLIGVSRHDIPNILRIISPISILYGLIIVHVMNYQLIEEKRYSITTSRLFKTTAIFSAIIVIIDIARGENTGYFFSRDDFSPTPVYYAYYVVFFIAELIIMVPSLILFMKNIRRYNDTLWKIRCSLGFLGYLTPIIYAIIAFVNLLLSVLYKNQYRYDINKIGSFIVALVGIIWVLYVMSHTVFPKIVERSRRKNEEREEYIHQRWMQIAPDVQYKYNSSDGSEAIRGKRIAAEIQQARYLAWTHEPSMKPITPKEDADYMFDLLSKGAKIDTVGLAIPQPPAGDARKHSIRVAKILKRMERRRRIINNLKTAIYTLKKEDS